MDPIERIKEKINSTKNTISETSRSLARNKFNSINEYSTDGNVNKNN